MNPTPETTPRDWNRCSFCWRPLDGNRVLYRGRPYCDDRCSSHDPAIAQAGELEPVPAEQLSLTG